MTKDNRLSLCSKKEIILESKMEEFEEFKQALVKQLKTIVTILERNHVTWWITGGTLLGFYRDNDIIKADYDTDLAIAAETMNEQCIRELMNCEYKIVQDHNKYLVDPLLYIAGIKHGGFLPDRNWKFEDPTQKFFGELKMTPHIDIFPYTLHDGKRWKRVYPERMRWHLDKNMLPIRKLNCKYGIFNVPNNPDEYLRMTYGDDWRTPKYNLDMHHAAKYENRISRTESGDIRIDMKTGKTMRFMYPYQDAESEKQIIKL